MKVELDLSKSIEKNAEFYYEKSKKARHKILGAESVLADAFKKLEALRQNPPEKKASLKLIRRKKHWYEKFRWFLSSEGFLCVGGMDATTNDILVKKHLDKDDIVFHTELAGSPFFVVKSEGKNIGDSTLNEVAQATASFSRAWRNKVAAADVYFVKPDQLKKELGLPKGSFMVYGKRNYSRPVVELALGLTPEGLVMCAPKSAVLKHCSIYVILMPGSSKKSDVAKDLKRFFEKSSSFKVELDDLMHALPPGDCSVQR